MDFFEGSGLSQPRPPPPPPTALTLPSAERITIGVLPPADGAPFPSSFEEQFPNLVETTAADLRIGSETFSILFHGLQGSKLLFTTCFSVRTQFHRRGFSGTPFLSVKKWYGCSRFGLGSPWWTSGVFARPSKSRDVKRSDDLFPGVLGRLVMARESSGTQVVQVVDV